MKWYGYVSAGEVEVAGGWVCGIDDPGGGGLGAGVDYFLRWCECRDAESERTECYGYGHGIAC